MKIEKDEKFRKNFLEKCFIVRTNVLAIICSIGVYILGFVGEGVLSKNFIYKYLLTPNLDLTAYLPGGTLPFSEANVWFSFFISMVYMIMFLLGGYLLFTKRDVY